jgi:hypothetical protein
MELVVRRQLGRRGSRQAAGDVGEVRFERRVPGLVRRAVVDLDLEGVGGPGRARPDRRRERDQDRPPPRLRHDRPRTLSR